MIVIVPGVEVGATRQGISFVLFAREVDKGEVVVGETGNVTCDTAVYVLGMAVVFEVFVVGVDRHGVGGSHEEVAPVSEATD